MDIEFHYYMTYLIAARAGFSSPDACIIAQAAQEVDDNHIPIAVSTGTPEAYLSTISQTMDILHPVHNRRIYPIFHFIPGDPQAPTARRKDGLTSRWVTTPDSLLAQEMLDTALASGDLNRIGASAHAYADTWAHQNFLGKDDGFNEMPGESLGEKIEGLVSLMRIGHALAGHKPDIPGLIWTDGRLVNPVVDNTPRFLDAAAALFRKLRQHRTGAPAGPDTEGEIAALKADLAADIGPSSAGSVALDGARIRRYRQRALDSPYGATPMPDYQVGRWADAAFVEKRADIKIRLAVAMEERAGMAGDILAFGTRMPCTWNDPAQYRQTEWFKFQEAVKSHLEECAGMLAKRLPEFVP